LVCSIKKLANKEMQRHGAMDQFANESTRHTGVRKTFVFLIYIILREQRSTDKIKRAPRLCYVISYVTSPALHFTLHHTHYWVQQNCIRRLQSVSIAHHLQSQTAGRVEYERREECACSCSAREHISILRRSQSFLLFKPKV
jgi:hypothetical protein